VCACVCAGALERRAPLSIHNCNSLDRECGHPFSTTHVCVGAACHRHSRLPSFARAWRFATGVRSSFLAPLDERLESFSSASWRWARRGSTHDRVHVCRACLTNPAACGASSRVFSVCSIARLRGEDHRIQSGSVPAPLVQWEEQSHPLVSIKSRSAYLLSQIERSAPPAPGERERKVLRPHN
jgi:hypothetical protein